MTDGAKNSTSIVNTPPTYCQYAGGACDQSFDPSKAKSALFFYPSEPVEIASIINAAVDEGIKSGSDWGTWEHLDTAGQIIFCSICKSARFAKHLIADVTTLNFNLLFEIGFSLGLGLPVIPIRDTNFVRDKAKFEELTLLDTMGYLDFRNSNQLRESVDRAIPTIPIPTPPADINYESPLYVLKGPVDTESEIRLLSALKKSVVRFRTYDTIETPRLSLHEVRKQTAMSLGVVAHLLSPDREGSEVHNARCALIAGLAMASGKIVLLLQEGRVRQPIDYRDVVVSYEKPAQVPQLTEPMLRAVIDKLQSRLQRESKTPQGLLQRLDIGDVAAENEIRPLQSYFLETGQYHEARRGHARLVVGRKGSGKTAVFYAVRNSTKRGHATIVLDLKPEGHQFTRLREVVLSKLTPGVQEHTLTAFWNLILLSEIAHKIVEEEYSWAQRDETRRQRFEELKDAYEGCGLAETGDFSERLLNHVDRIASWKPDAGTEIDQDLATEILFSVPIKRLNDAVAAYVDEKEKVWLLVDNLDKAWPTRGTTDADILIVRTLLEATRKLQRSLERRDVSFHALVFLRADIYDHLIQETPDKGKETAITLDWSDAELFKEIIRLRIVASGALQGSFEEIWSSIVALNVGTRDSFAYMVERTLMRPRDFLSFLHRAIEVAINRGHNRVTQGDLEQAEKYYSEDILQTTAFELRDVYPQASMFLYVFLGSAAELSRPEVLKLLSEELPDTEAEKALELLAWFGFLGVRKRGEENPRFSYDMRYDMVRLLAPIKRDDATFVIHPAFRSALECVAIDS